MPVPGKTNLALSRPLSAAPRFRIVTEILIWNAAWHEYRRLQRLDAAALDDMAVTRTARASVSVAQIAARMRG